MHAKGKYARGKGEELVTTNTVEGMFGVFKPGMTGVYQHCGEQHLQRYLDKLPSAGITVCSYVSRIPNAH